MTYADKDALMIELKEQKDQLDDDLINRGITRADQMVKRKLKNTKIPIPTPEEITEAATLYAAARILDILFPGQEARSPTARQNDKDADEILEGYIEEIPETGSGVEIGLFTLSSQNDEDDEEPNWW